MDPESGEQPLYNEKKDVVLGVNGEIYNYKELENSLKKEHNFKTKSDCEVILYLYEEHGINFVSQLNGIFAFVLYDETQDAYMIARDHMGIIPLYMGRDRDGGVWISSELKGLHDVCVTFQDFPPGHTYWSKTESFVKWYKPIWHDEAYLSTNAMDLVALREGLEAAVERQLMSDVPFGTLLSGGLDSSLITAIACRVLKKKENLPFPRLHTFSIGLNGSPDLAAAQVVADKLGTVHHGWTFTIEQGLNALSSVIYHLETYDVTTCRAATPMFLMSRKIKALGVKMVLSGEGADEMFGGYLYFHKCPDRTEFQKETVRKLKSLYKFDCLRANKSCAAWGVEARVPFLDKLFLDQVMSEINPTDKMCGFKAEPKGRMEKWILRKAFEGYLPDEVLWRQKEQFSDGVGYSWIDSLRDQANTIVIDDEFKAAKYKFPHNTPHTKESYMIRDIFETHFPEQSAREAVPGGPSVACSTPAAVLWDASFAKFADCSGRSVGVHNSAYDEEERASGVVGVIDESTLAKSEELVALLSQVDTSDKSIVESAAKAAAE